jgi:NADH-quinone oxidoreductase subunit G
MASQQLFDAVPFYSGLTLEEIGGKGVRWQERPEAGAYGGPQPPSEATEEGGPGASGPAGGRGQRR